MVGVLGSFWDSLFSGAMLVSGSVIFLFTPIPGEMIQFDDIIFCKGVETTNQFLRVFYPAIGVPNGNSYIWNPYNAD